MGCDWNLIRFQFSCTLFFIISLQSRSSLSLNSEGFTLLKFRERVESDPHGVLANWGFDHDNVCLWSGVTCLNGKVLMLNLSGCSLQGTLAPELNQLSELRYLILSKNHFHGEIPNEFRDFAKLEVLDLQYNDLSGQITPQLSHMLILLSGNKLEKLPEPSSSAGLRSSNRKLGVNKAKDLLLRIKATSRRYIPFKISDHVKNFIANLPSPLEELDVLTRHRLLEETDNVAAVPATSPSPEISPAVYSQSSGSFPAVPSAKTRSPPLIPTPSSPSPPPSPTLSREEKKPQGLRGVWLYLIITLAALLSVLIILAVVLLYRKRAIKSIGPWKTGLSGQLQKAFVTGVPKLNRSELETACEDFSNIIEAFDGYTVYKGTLSSGVEIAVASTAISSSAEWTRAMEMTYRRKIDTLSRINHKNFVNLIGYCEEDEPFNRMMVFEYAPNGTIYEHIHVEEMEDLDWSVRMRIIMGTAYCLQYMHELNPPIAHSNLSSSAIYLTDDYAAKIAEIPFNSQTGLKPRKTVSGDLDQLTLPIPPEPESNVYTFGLLLLEIISGKLRRSDDGETIEQWAMKYLEDENDDRLGEMVDPTLKSFKDEELEMICEVIRQCLRSEPRERPTMKEIVEQLQEAINISPDQATPRLSPLWWAELEILSSEAT